MQQSIRKEAMLKKGQTQNKNNIKKEKAIQFINITPAVTKDVEIFPQHEDESLFRC